MKRLTHIFLIASIAPVLFFAVALSPVQLLGCRTRGLLALLIALASGVAAICTGVIGLRGRIRGDSDAFQWVIITLIMNYPAASSGVSQGTGIMDAASGGESDPSELSKALERRPLSSMINSGLLTARLTLPVIGVLILA